VPSSMFTYAFDRDRFESLVEPNEPGAAR
jgi:hypothetical protein